MKSNKKPDSSNSFHFYQKQRKSVTSGAMIVSSLLVSLLSLSKPESQSHAPLTTTVARQCRGISGVTKELRLANHHLKLHSAKTVLRSRRNTTSKTK